jgi:hypothetical protein
MEQIEAFSPQVTIDVCMADTHVSLRCYSAQNWRLRVTPMEYVNDDINAGGVQNGESKTVPVTDRQAAAIMFLICCDQDEVSDIALIHKLYKLQSL